MQIIKLKIKNEDLRKYLLKPSRAAYLRLRDKVQSESNGLSAMIRQSVELPKEAFKGTVAKRIQITFWLHTNLHTDIEFQSKSLNPECSQDQFWPIDYVCFTGAVPFQIHFNSAVRIDLE